MISDLSERELIARIQTRLQPLPDWVVVGIGDDAAVVEPERNRLEVLTVDAIVEGVHFDRQFTPPAAIGHRALAVNLSDLAAMGAEPRLALLSLALPPSLTCADFDAMIDGLATLARLHRVHVVGGNLTRSPGPLVLDVTVSGTIKRRQVLRRQGAKPGDLVFVTGTIGAAAAGLQMLRSSSAAIESCTARYLYPQPRVREGLLLARNRAATACMDLSDGLADAVRQIAEASQVGITVDADALPIDEAARRCLGSRDDAIELAVSGGDDYELLFTVRPGRLGRLKALRLHGAAVATKIGVCTGDRNVTLRRGSTGAPMPHGYKHFR